ncbi:MAG TPA: orotidine-5'-phosphate decarboxylase [Chitinophagaceae bacterium]
MTRQFLSEQIRLKRSYLCVGLDSDPAKLPVHLKHSVDAVYEFNKAIIDATAPHCVSYKINTAFYEAWGIKGWDVMERTLHYIPSTHFKIADAKRGDIGNTSSQYAKAFFETLPFDAVTVTPYMGEDSIRPFLEYPGKFTIVLGLTSNAGAKDFELLRTGSELLYEAVIRKVATWGNPDNLMFVTGATQADQFSRIRKIAPDNFLLVPGIGAQGGSLEEVSEYGMNKDCGLLVNVSRSIIFAGSGTDYSGKAAAAAAQYQQEMGQHIQQYLDRHDQ